MREPEILGAAIVSAASTAAVSVASPTGVPHDEQNLLAIGTSALQERHRAMIFSADSVSRTAATLRGPWPLLSVYGSRRRSSDDSFEALQASILQKGKPGMRRAVRRNKIPKTSTPGAIVHRPSTPSIPASINWMNAVRSNRLSLDSIECLSFNFKVCA